MILSVAAAIFAAQLGTGMEVVTRPPVETVQHRRPIRCGHGADLDIRDGRCYPNGTVPPQFQQQGAYPPDYDDDDYYDRRPRRRYY